MDNKKELKTFKVVLPDGQNVQVEVEPSRTAKEIAETIARKMCLAIPSGCIPQLYLLSTGKSLVGTARDLGHVFTSGDKIGLQIAPASPFPSTVDSAKGKTSKLAILALSLGCVLGALIFVHIPLKSCLHLSLSGPSSPELLTLSLPVVILAHIALYRVKKRTGKLKGRGFAIAGLVIGYWGIVFPLMGIFTSILKPRVVSVGTQGFHSLNSPSMSETVDYISFPEINVADFGTVSQLSFLPDYVQLSSDGTSVFAIGLNGAMSTIQIMQLAELGSSNPVAIEGLTGVCWGPDNNTLLVTRGNGLYALSFNAGLPFEKPLVTMPHPDSRLVAEEFKAPRLSPSGKEVAFLIHKPPPPTGDFRRSKLTWLCYMGLLDSSYTEVITGDDEHRAPSWRYEWNPSEKSFFCLADTLLNGKEQIWFVPKGWHSEKTVLSDTEGGVSKDGGETYSFGFIKCSPNGSGISFVRRSDGWETSSLCYYSLENEKVREIYRDGVIGNWWANQGKVILFFSFEESKAELKRSLWLTASTLEGASKKIVKLQDIKAFEDEYAEVSDYSDVTKTLVFYDVNAKSLKWIKLNFSNTD